MTDDDNKLRRLSIDITAQERRALRAHAVKADMSIRALVVQALRKEGLLVRSKKRGP